jgi:hypothetical protein
MLHGRRQGMSPSVAVAVAVMIAGILGLVRAFLVLV